MTLLGQELPETLFSDIGVLTDFVQKRGQPSVRDLD